MQSTFGRIANGLGRVDSVTFDMEPVHREMDYWSKWLEDPQTQSDMMATAQGLDDAFNQAKLRLDVHGGQIFSPVIDNFELMRDSMMMNKDCHTNAMVKCILSQRDREAENPEYLQGSWHYLAHGTCAKAHNCEPKIERDADHDSYQAW